MAKPTSTIWHQIWIDALGAKVFKAISTEDGIGHWWDKPRAMEWDIGPILEFSPGAEHGMLRMKLLDQVENTRVEWKCVSKHPSSSPDSAWTGTHVLFEISERGNVVALSGFGQDQEPAAILDFRHSGWDENSEYLGLCNYARGEALHKLKQWCESDAS
ncbi:MAG: hypothetical protein ACT4QA_22805 [Panacagrimonas sp.]